MKKYLFFSLLITTMAAWAYTPKLVTILTKIAINNGTTQALVIKRNVTLKDEGITWQEIWTIAHADLIKLDVKGLNADKTSWDVEILYKDGKRTTTTVEGVQKSFPLSSEFFEPLLHFRNTRALASKLITMQVLPTWASGQLSERDTTSAKQQDYIVLDRFKGTIVYAIGANNSKNTQLPPRLWVEQDSFEIKKLRMGSQIEVEFENYKKYDSDKIKQPSVQTIFWKNATVIIENTSLEIVNTTKIANVFKIQKNAPAQLPVHENIKEFYSRFR